jgi:hypothetical protein
MRVSRADARRFRPDQAGRARAWLTVLFSSRAKHRPGSSDRLSILCERVTAFCSLRNIWPRLPGFLMPCQAAFKKPRVWQRKMHNEPRVGSRQSQQSTQPRPLANRFLRFDLPKLNRVRSASIPFALEIHFRPEASSGILAATVDYEREGGIQN